MVALAACLIILVLLLYRHGVTASTECVGTTLGGSNPAPAVLKATVVKRKRGNRMQDLWNHSPSAPGGRALNRLPNRHKSEAKPRQSSTWSRQTLLCLHVKPVLNSLEPGSLRYSGHDLLCSVKNRLRQVWKQLRRLNPQREFKMPQRCNPTSARQSIPCTPLNARGTVRPGRL